MLLLLLLGGSIFGVSFLSALTGFTFVFVAVLRDGGGVVAEEEELVGEYEEVFLHGAEEGFCVGYV